MEPEIRDRISQMLSENGYPNGENDIDEVENLVWDDISDDELLKLCRDE